MQIVEKQVETVVDTEASASAVGKCLVHQLGIRIRARKVKVRHTNGSFLKGTFIVNTLFKVMDSSSVLGSFVMDIQVLDVGNRHIILKFS